MNVLFSEHSNEIYKSIIDYNPDPIFTFSIEGKIVGANHAATDIFGYTNEEILNFSYQDIFNPDELDKVNYYFNKVVEGIACEYDADAFHKNGQTIHLEIKNIPLIVDKEVVAIFCVTKDITIIKKIEKSLIASEERYRLIAKNMTDLVGIWDINGVVKYASPSHEFILGLASEQFEGEIAFNFIYEEDVLHAEAQFLHMVQTRENQVMEFRYKHLNGNLIWIEAKATPIIDDEGNILHFLVVARDINERKRFEEKLNNMAYHDTLTGIANRRLFQERLEQSLKNAELRDSKPAVMYMDLDEFKQINDNYGHDAGDELLKQLSQRVQHCIRENDILARLGGDEFTILLSGITKEQDAIQIAERILSHLQEPWHIGENLIRTTSSIGIAFYPKDGTTSIELMKNADAALYEAKKSGRNKLKTYS